MKLLINHDSQPCTNGVPVQYMLLVMGIFEILDLVGCCCAYVFWACFIPAICMPVLEYLASVFLVVSFDSLNCYFSFRLRLGVCTWKATLESIRSRWDSMTLDLSILLGNITDLTSYRPSVYYCRRDKCLLRGDCEGASMRVETPNFCFRGEFIPELLFERVV